MGWTSCYLPPRTCGIGSKNRTREKRADATHKGEKCAELRIIEVTEHLNCEVPCTPVDCEVGPWGNWSSCSVTCDEGTKERTREKIADAVNGGVECLAERSLISLTEQTVCKDEDCPGEEMLVRKQVGNPAEYFNKNFADYEAGFSSRGEMWLGLRKLHQLTSAGDYSLNITLTDFDGKSYNAFYDQFQVGPGGGYVLSVSGFDAGRSTLGDSFSYGNGKKFSAKDKDQDTSKKDCALHLKGGGWFEWCHHSHLTGLHTTSSQNNPAPGGNWGGTQIWWTRGGERVTSNSGNSWKEAKMVM